MRLVSEPRVIFGSRLALMAGFGGLLLVMALAGIDAQRVLRQYRERDDEIRGRFLAQNHVLNDIRSEVYVSGTYVRDYLLDPNQALADGYRSNLESVRARMEAALDTYGRQVTPAESHHFTELRTELLDYWKTLAPALNWSPEDRRQLGYAFLRDEVFPRRQSMLTIADQIGAINEQQLTNGNDQAASLLSRFQMRLLLTLVAALVIGLSMALFSSRTILRLEGQAHQRYEEAADARSQLTALSARLVQAQETERRALSRELHDEVGQSLSAVLVELRNLSLGLSIRSAEELDTHVETIKGLVENTVRVVRNMSLLLRPSMLDDLGLIPALKWQARETSKRTGMDVSVAAEIDSDNLPDQYNTCIYRVVQEALHNCARHSQASSVRIRFTQRAESMNLMIQDDGRGFDSRNVKGLGLLGIHERVARLGGKCEIQSKPGMGATIAVELPCVQEQKDTDKLENDPHPVS